MKTISIDIETKSGEDISRNGVYRYTQSPDFEILLFGYAVDGGEVNVIDMAHGERIPKDVLEALTDERVEKWAFNANFERVCLSRYLSDLGMSLDPFADNHSLSTERGQYLSPCGWHCTMVWAAYMGLPLSLAAVGSVLGLEEQKLSEGKALIRQFCKGELLITIMSSLAQEEARSISENTTWGHRKRFADGKVTVPFKHFLGYDRGADGNLVVNPEQAKTVRLIYKLFLSGLSYMAIGRELMKHGIKSPTGGERWYPRTIQSLLTNEKMKGDALLQKNYTVDFLTKKQVRNEGQVPQYYVTGNHEAIIPPETFDLVQAEIERRRSIKRYSGVTIFSNRIKCGECGQWYGSKVWHSTDKYRRVIWQCNHKFEGARKCATPHLMEEEIKAAFVKAFNRLFKGKEILLENLKEVRARICDTKKLEAEKMELADELHVLADIVQNCISENARIAQNQADYQKRYDEMVSRYEEAKAKYDAAIRDIQANNAKAERLDAFAKALENRAEALTEFDEGLWGTLVEHMTVYGKRDIGITFKDGNEIRI